MSKPFAWLGLAVVIVTMFGATASDASGFDCELSCPHPAAAKNNNAKAAPGIPAVLLGVESFLAELFE
jgi:hypothetical protein